MSLRRGLTIVIAGVALAASLGVVIVALLFALHALLASGLGNPGATAVVLAVVALLVAGGALAAQWALRPRTAPPSASGTALVDRALVFVRDRPVVSMAGAVAIGAVVVANPIFIARLARAFMERRQAGSRD